MGYVVGQALTMKKISYITKIREEISYKTKNNILHRLEGKIKILHKKWPAPLKYLLAPVPKQLADYLPNWLS